MTGWDSSFLQEAIDTCGNPSGELSDCELFTSNGPLLSQPEQQQCKFKTPVVLAAENDVAQIMTQLPGGIQIQDGPQSATPPGDSIDQPTSSAGNIVSSTSSLSTTSSSSSSSSIQSVPTTTASSTPQPGGAFIENPSSSTPGFAVENIPSTTASTSSTSTSILPATTSVPQPTSEPGVSYEVASTQTITSPGGMVEVIVWMQPVVYVTEDVVTTVTIPGPAPQNVKKARDHVVHHRHNHGRRGY
jgi:hypothetical protein